MRNSPYTYVLIGVILMIVIYVFTNKGSNETTDEEYYNQIGLKLDGIVTNQKSIDYGHGYSIVTMNIINSNLITYDQRKNLNAHLGVINNKKANIVFNSTVRIGDSIVIDVRNYKIFRKGKLISENILSLPTSDYFMNPFRDINKKTSL